MAPYRRVLPTPTATAVAALLLALTWSGTTCLAADLGFNKVIVPCNGSSTFQCAGDGKCILSKYKCDGVKHCTDNSDEVGCGNEKCDEKQHFTCAIDSECIPLVWRCDGQIDCNDDSDEKGCTTAANVTAAAACSGSEFQCKQGLCIPRIWHCDGHPDCLDDSDEEDCQAEDLHRQPCHEFSCGDDKDSCVPKRWVCDGVPDCPNGFDEESCLHHNEKPDCPLSNGSFLCKDHSGCIGFNLLCNGVKDCEDGSDESANCNVTCPAHNICSQGCIHLPNHKKESCFCRDGFMLAADNRTCYDVNECEEFGFCSHNCKNTEGGYACSCEPGYSLLEDGRTCLADDDNSAPILYFSGKSEIGSFNLRTQEISIVSADKKWVKDAVGVSYDGIDNRVFWTNVQTGNQSIVSSKVDGSDVRIVVTDNLRMPEDVAVDSLTRNLYFTDSGFRVIRVCSIDGRACRNLITHNVDQPRGLALYPAEGLLFYSDWGRHPHISRAGMDGSNHISIIRHDIKWPNGIAVDPVLKRIFWSDAQFDRLESAKLNGDDRKVILEHVIRHPFSLAVFEDTLYWSDWHTKEVQACDKFYGDHHKTVLADANGSPMGIHIFHPILEPVTKSPCYGMPCSHLCLLAYGGKQAVCHCPDGKTLNSDKHTCTSTDMKILAEVEREKELMQEMSPRTLPPSNATPPPVVVTSTTSAPSDDTASEASRDLPLQPPEETVIQLHHDPDYFEGDPSVGHSRIKQHSNVISIVIGVCLSIALFLLIAAAACICYKRRKIAKGEPLRFPNPTFGFPGGLKSVKVDAAGAGPATKWHSSEPLTSHGGARGNDKLEPPSGHLEFVNCSWSQPKLLAGSSTPMMDVDTIQQQQLRRSATNPEISKSRMSADHPLHANDVRFGIVDDSDDEEGASGGDDDSLASGWDNDKRKLLQ